MKAHGAAADDSDTSGRSEAPGSSRPRAVQAAVAILGVLALSGLLSLVSALVVGAPPMIEAFVGTTINVVISLLLGWFLWRGSNTARVWTLVLTGLGLLTVVAAAIIAGVGPVDLYLAWTLVETALGVALLVLLFAPATRSWCRRLRAVPAQVASPDLSSSQDSREG